MLGRLIGGARWEWAVFGKHPVAKDYFQFNLVSSMAKAFAKWVDTGFRQLTEDQRRNTACSWRFWARGQKKSAMVCGLGKCSSDSIGRPYPMIILGEGKSEQWEKYWHLTLANLQATWETIEYTVARRLRSLEQLESDIQHVPAPRKQWSELAQEAKTMGCGATQDACRKVYLTDVQQKARSFDASGELVIPLAGEGNPDPFQLASAWHVALKDAGSPAPNTAFMGGRPDKSVLVLYHRPLIVEDFSRLWTI